jgi:hypothetical protein
VKRSDRMEVSVVQKRVGQKTIPVEATGETCSKSHAVGR